MAIAPRRAYLAPMKYLKRFSPRTTVSAVDDLLAYWRQPTPYRWQILGVAVAMTFTLMVLLIPESERAPPDRPTVTYITTFDPDRTTEQIIASNIENQKRKDERAAELAARAERRRERARALARASGFDPDDLERQFADTPATAPAPAAEAKGKGGN